MSSTVNLGVAAHDDGVTSRCDERARLEQQGREDAQLDNFRPPSESTAVEERPGVTARQAYADAYWREWHRLAFERGDYLLL